MLRIKRKTAKNIIYWSCVATLGIIVLLCVSVIAEKAITDKQDKNNWDSIVAQKESMAADVTRPPIPDEPIIVPDEPEIPDAPTRPTEPIVESDILFEYRAFYELNSDMVGWIKIEGTNVNYPVMQTPNQRDFYLRRDFEKKDATCGSIYAREECDINRPSDNVVLYGHNMGNGTMFGDLHKYKDKSFWENNKYVFFDTLTEYHTYEIFAVFTTSADMGQGFSYHLFNDTNDAAKFDKFVNTCLKLSFYDTDIQPKYGEKLLTLSTCNKSDDYNGRLVVVCRRLV
jgi:sortase B